MPAEQSQVVEVGAASGFPRDDVVDIGEGDVGAAREATTSVPAHHLSALGVGGEPLGPDPRTWCARGRRRGRRPWWRHRRSAAPSRHRSGPRIPVRRRGRSPGPSPRPGRPGGRGPRRHRGWSWWLVAGALSLVSGADQSQQDVAATLVQGCLTVGGDLLELGVDAGLDLGVGIGRQLGADGAVGVVEAQEATIVLGTRTRRRRSPSQLDARAGEVGQLTHRMQLGLSQSRRSLSGVATSASALTLSKEISPSESEPRR